MVAPSQNDVVEIGHMVKVKFMDEYGDFSLVHILKNTDKNNTYLNDDENEMIVSDTSPLGKALLGSTKGKVVTYNEKYKAKVIDAEDAIQVSTFLK